MEIITMLQWVIDHFIPDIQAGLQLQEGGIQTKPNTHSVCCQLCQHVYIYSPGTE